MTTGFSWSQAIWAPHSYAEVCLNFAEIWSVCKNSALSLTPRSQAQRCNTLSGVIDTTESSSTVFLTPRCQAQRCYWHQGFKLSGVINTAESSSVVLLTPWSQVHLSYCHLKLSGVTVVSSSAVPLTLWSQTPRCQCLYKVKNVVLNFSSVFSNLKIKFHKVWCCFFHDSNSIEPKIHGLTCSLSRFWRYFLANFKFKNRL